MSPKQACPFVLEIPIHLSQVAAEGGAQELRVVARAHDGALTSGTVTGEASGRATASLAFADNPGPLQIMVGPASATETQLVNLQTISVNVPGDLGEREHRRDRSDRGRTVLLVVVA